MFQQKAHLFSSDFSKVSYLVGLLRGKELAWAEAVSSRNSLETMTYAGLEGSLKAVFDHPDQPGDATTHLLSLHQGNCSVADFSEFWILAAYSGWNEPAIRGAFLQGLSERLQDELILWHESQDLHSFVFLAISLDNRLRVRGQGRASRTPVHPSFPSAPPVPSPSYLGSSIPVQVGHAVPSSSLIAAEQPMQLGHAKLTSEEHHHRF